MLCPNCQTENPDGAFCANCGAKLTAAEPQVEPQVEPQAVPQAVPAAPAYAAPQPQPPYQPPYQVPQSVEDQLPEQYKPLSPWAYFGLTLLYSIPIVGFIFLIIFSFKKSNINRRNFTRSYWCGLIILAAILVIYLIIAAVVGVSLINYY